MIKYKKSIKLVSLLFLVLAFVSVSSCTEDGSSASPSANFKEIDGATAPGTRPGR